MGNANARGHEPYKLLYIKAIYIRVVSPERRSVKPYHIYRIFFFKKDDSGKRGWK